MFVCSPTEAVESLRDAVMENTSCAQRSKSRRRVGASHAPRSGGGASSRANGLPLLKDDKINVRKEKVSDALVCVCDVLVPALRR